MTDYSKIIKAVVKTIRTKGIPLYVKRFDKLYKDTPLIDFANEKDFLEYINTIIHYYHPHTLLYKQDDPALPKKNNKPTGFSFGSDKIGKIQLFSFTSHNGPAKYEIEKKKYIEEINIFLDTATENGMKGLIIDFSAHGGGGVWQTIDAFKRYFNNTTLFAWSNMKIGFNEKKWINIEKNAVAWNRPYLTKEIDTPFPIAIIVGKKTASAGEITAAMFKSSSSVKVFGERTKGLLSMNAEMSIGDEYGLIFTSTLLTTKDGKFLEYLDPDVVTKSPVVEAKKWIKHF